MGAGSVNPGAKKARVISACAGWKYGQALPEMSITMA